MFPVLSLAPGIVDQGIRYLGHVGPSWKDQKAKKGMIEPPPPPAPALDPALWTPPGIDALLGGLRPDLCVRVAGRWQMLYSTVPGPSSGRLGPFVGNVFQEIRPAEGRSESSAGVVPAPRWRW